MNREEYIGILETENAKLKESNKNLLESIIDSSNDYQELFITSSKYFISICKAIEYIEKHRKENAGCKLNFAEVDKVLEILKESDK